MKANEYNPRAREAFANSLITLGVAVYKGIILLVTVVPLALILKSTLEPDSKISLLSLLDNISISTQWAFLAILSFAFLIGHSLRKEGLRHLHELDDVNYE